MIMIMILIIFNLIFFVIISLKKTLLFSYILILLDSPGFSRWFSWVLLLLLLCLIFFFFFITFFSLFRVPPCCSHEQGR